MSKYFISTQHNEYIKQQKCLGIKIGKQIPTIDMISIGIVSEDYKFYTYPTKILNKSLGKVKKNIKSKEYYAISKDFNIKDAWNNYRITGIAHKEYWIRDNILKPIFEELMELSLGYKVGSYADNWFNLKEFTKLIKLYGKSNEQIAEEIKKFVTWTDVGIDKTLNLDKIKVYGYKLNHSMVLLKQLFENKISYPVSSPDIIIDIKQQLTSIKLPLKIIKYGTRDSIDSKIPKAKEYMIYKIEEHPEYPKISDGGTALHRALWIKELYKFAIRLLSI